MQHQQISKTDIEKCSKASFPEDPSSVAQLTEKKLNLQDKIIESRLTSL